MSRTRFSRFVVAMLALALWAGTAYGQATTYTFTGPAGGLLNTASTVFTVTPDGTYTGTITITPSGGGLSTPQVLTFTASSAAQTLTFTPTAVGPVTLTPTNSGSLTDAAALTYNTPPAAPTIGAAVPGNASATVAYTASAGNGGSAITGYTATCNPGSHQNTGVSPISITGLTNGTQYTCSVTAANAIGSSAASGTVQVTPAVQPLLPSLSPVPLSFTQGTTTLTPNTSTIKVAPGVSNATFALDQSTVPIWLTVTVPSGAASTGAGSVTGITVSFAGSDATILQGMAPGNYTANVGFAATGVSTANELKIPVTMTISSAGGGTISLVQGTAEIDIFTPPPAVPVPLVTPISNSGPIPFTASCVVVSTGYSGSAPCTLATGAVTPGQSPSGAAQSITGVAYNTPTPISTIFDPTLFALARPLGTVVTLTVTVAQSESVSVSLVYKYTLQYGAPTIASGSPTSVQSNLATLGNPLVVTLKGANFVAPSGLASGAAIVGTQVFVGAAAGAAGGTNLTTSAVVLNSTTIMVSIPTTNFPVSPAKTLVIGVANQQVTDTLPLTKPQSTYTVNFTSSPVIYAITSTASYNEPGVGNNPSVAPYELISIFGANFGVNNTSPNDTKNGIGTQDAYGKYLTTVNASGAGTTTSKYVTLAVSFKNVGAKSTTYAAPILFANATQINAIVPSQVPLTGVTTVTVTYGTLSSDGLFTVILAARDNDVERFFCSSSACVYNAARQSSPLALPLQEEDAYPAMPEDGYGWEKLFSERMCRHFREDFELGCCVARYHNVYGPMSAWRGGREKAPAAILPQGN